MFGFVHVRCADRLRTQALFDAHPELAARFPGGMMELAQVARQFPEEVLEALLGMVGMGGDEGVEAGVGVEERMPGGENVLAEGGGTREEVVVDAHQSEAEDDQEEEEEEEDETVCLASHMVPPKWTLMKCSSVLSRAHCAKPTRSVVETPRRGGFG